MTTTDPSENERIYIQEGGAPVIQDNALPAEQILAEQKEQAEPPGLFVP